MDTIGSTLLVEIVCRISCSSVVRNPFVYSTVDSRYTKSRERRNLFVLSGNWYFNGVTCMHLHWLGELNLVIRV